MSDLKILKSITSIEIIFVCFGYETEHYEPSGTLDERDVLRRQYRTLLNRRRSSWPSRLKARRI